MQPFMQKASQGQACVRLWSGLVQGQARQPGVPWEVPMRLKRGSASLAVANR